jgi:hemolysin III
MITLLVLAHGKPWHIAGYAIFGASMILLYLSSALYHGMCTSPQGIARLQRCDYGAIFLLIAGTYAPVGLVVLRRSLGLQMLAAEYLAAAIGIAMVIFVKNHREWLRVALYLVMGWLTVFSLPQLSTRLPHAALAWLVAGGLCYTVGTVVFATDRPKLWPGRFGSHDLWHLFVLAGSACHFILMFYIVKLA